VKVSVGAGQDPSALGAGHRAPWTKLHPHPAACMGTRLRVTAFATAVERSLFHQRDCRIEIPKVNLSIIINIYKWVG